MSTIWEYLESESITKNVPILTPLPSSSGAYGPQVFYDNITPVFETGMKARGMTLTELQTEMTKTYTRNTTYVYTMDTGETVTGYPIHVSGNRINGTYFFEVEIKVIRTDISSVL